MRHIQRGELIDPALIRAFASGWCKTRQVAEPVVVQYGALRIEVGLPEETRRYVFPEPPAGIAEMAAQIDTPHVLLKTPLMPEAVQALLPPRWHVERTGTMMTLTSLATVNPSLPDGFQFALDDLGDVAAARIAAPDGAIAARGFLTIVDGWALHDRINVEERYRRRGLGRAVMLCLGREGARRRASRGILTATLMGRALYQSIGWQPRAPWTTAQIKP